MKKRYYESPLKFVIDGEKQRVVEDSIKLLNKQDEHIKWLDNQILSLERRNNKQADRLDELYKLIEKNKWDRLSAIVSDLNSNYDV